MQMAVRGYSLEKDDYRKRLRRIEGQVRGLQRLIDDAEHCIDVLTQIASVTKVLHGVGVGRLAEDVGPCARDAATADPAAGDAKIDEAVQAVERLLRV